MHVSRASSCERLSTNRGATRERFVVDNDATLKTHLALIHSYKEAYISAGLAPFRPCLTRGRVLCAAVGYIALHSTSTVGESDAGAGSAHASQRTTQRGTLPESGTPFNRMASVVSSLVDRDVPIDALVEAAIIAAEEQILEVLEKMLCILASFDRTAMDAAAEEKDSNDVGDLDGLGQGTSGSGTAETEEDDEDCDSLVDADEELNSGSKRKKYPMSGPSGSKQKCARASRLRIGTAGRSGLDFVDEFITKFATKPYSGKNELWSVQKSISEDVFVATALRLVPQSAKASSTCVSALLARLRYVDVFELPAYSYQLLLFVSSRGKPAEKREALKQIIHNFEDLERNAKNAAVEASQVQCVEEDEIIVSAQHSKDSIRDIEGTALLHFDFAIKQDPGLHAEVVKLAKVAPDSPDSIMTPFGIAVLLSLMRTPSLRTSLQASICEAIARYEREVATRKSNAFAASLVREDPSLKSPIDALICIVEYATESGWDTICEPLLQVGLQLMERPELSVGADMEKDDGGGSSSLAERILCSLFADHAPMRHEITSQLLSRIVLQEKSSSEAVVIISKLMSTATTLFFDQTQKIKESLGDLISLKPWVAARLLEAYAPLFHARPDVEDFAMLCLRKALFHRDATTRAIACMGFLTMIRNHAERKRSANQADEVMDAIQPLRRVFSFGAPLRALLYRELSKVAQCAEISGKQSELGNAFAELLISHMMRFVDASQSPYLLLERCVHEHAGGRLAEPLGDLIACATAIELGCGRSLSGSHLMDLAKKVSALSLHDFDLSKQNQAGTQQEPDESENDGTIDEASRLGSDRANRNRARLLGGVAESLINVALSAEEAAHTLDLYQSIVFPLLQMREDVLALLKRLGGATAADALEDLGGDPHIEGISPRSVGWTVKVASDLKHGGNPETGKKGKGNAKKPAKEFGSPASGDSIMRFGSFGVLVSSASCPVVSLNTALRCLIRMNGAGGETAEDGGEISSWFLRNRESPEQKRLRVFLHSVVRTHVERLGLSPEDGASPRAHKNAGKDNALASLCGVVRFFMGIFKDSRGQKGQEASRQSVRALEVVNMCLQNSGTACGKDRAILYRLCSAMLPEGSAERDPEPSPGLVLLTLESLQDLASSLIEDGLCREAEMALRLHDTLRVSACSCSVFDTRETNKLLASMAAWGKRTLSQYETKDAPLMRRVVRLFVCERNRSDCMGRIVGVADRIRAVLGEINLAEESATCTQEELTRTKSVSMIVLDNALAAVELLLDILSEHLTDIEWCLARMMSTEAAVLCLRQTCSTSVSDHGTPRKSPAEIARETEALEALEARVNAAEDDAQQRLGLVVDALKLMLSTAILKWSAQERLVKVVTRTYKALSISAQAQVRRRDDPRPSFLDLLKTTKELAPCAWTYMSFVSSQEKRAYDGDDPIAPKASSSAAKEARVMPNLVYEVEKFEKLLIAAQKHTKTSLLRGIKRNTARDYRIAANMFQARESETASATTIGAQ